MEKAVKAKLERILYGNKQTIGKWYCLDKSGYIKKWFDTLELAWKGNKTSISCIPENTYTVTKRYTKARGWHLHIQDVEGRTWILVHKGNYYYHIEGCILPGLKLVDMNNDDLLDVAHSEDALNEILELMPDTFELEITSVAGADQLTT